jgi:hypothetical protein
MARPKLGDTETERLQLKITTAEIEAIDDWRFANRIPSRSEALRRLCQMALTIEASQDTLDRDFKNSGAAFVSAIKDYDEFVESLNGREPAEDELKLVNSMLAVTMAMGEAYATMLDRLRLAGYFRKDHDMGVIMSDVEKARRRFSSRRDRLLKKDNPS